MSLPKVAVLCDLLEEHWPSMDLVAEMLVGHLNTSPERAVSATAVRPSMRRRVSAPGARRGRRFTADRLIGRFWDYPRRVSGIGSEFDLFHVIDHSYAHLVHHLPPGRRVVTCHDLDAFRSVLEPSREKRGAAFRAMTSRILSGIRKAERIACVSMATRDELLSYRIVDDERVVVVPNGVALDYSPEADPVTDSAVSQLLGNRRSAGAILLHVGSTIPRKRIDVLLLVLAEVRRVYPGLSLVRVGDDLTAAQRELAEELGIENAIIQLPFLPRAMLAAVYRRATLLLHPSDSEGFGLTVLEAMACGTPVVCSDLTVLREVAGPAATFCPPGDVAAWAHEVEALLKQARFDEAGWTARRSVVLSRAREFSWAENARRFEEVYLEMMRS